MSLPQYGPRPLRPLNDHMRHGFDQDYNSENFLSVLANTFYIYFDDKRHNTSGNPVTEEMKRSPELAKTYQPIPDWKVMKDRQKTILAAIVLCLNLGVDPPDIMKTYPCAKLEAWCDPLTFPDTKKAIELIGKALQLQYETLLLRTRYKQLLDPCVEDVKRFCNTLRRNAKDERILFHYNGHRQRRDLGVQPRLHPVHPHPVVRPPDVARRALHLCLRLQQRRQHRAQL
jgi:regulator-associated protein of mTOR